MVEPMKQARLLAYTLPMDSGVILRHTRLAQREGFIVELKDGERIGRGEIAPLPEFSVETSQEAGEQAKAVMASWLEGEVIGWDALYPSVAFGLSMAIAELEGELPLTGNFLAAPLCCGDPDELVERLAELPGQKVAKIKVGMYEPIRDGLVVNMFLEAIPDLWLRLDANRQWTLEKAKKFAGYIAPEFRQRIAFLEEPCQQPDDSLLFSAETGIAVAWDETVRDAGFEPAAQNGLSAIVIKPTLVGSLAYVCELVKEAKALGLDVVISSSLESSFGLNQLARLSHWLVPETIPGLDTISLFKAQLDTPWPGSDLPVMSLDSCDLVWQQRR